MDKTQTLKNEILAQYKSVRRFALELEIPYSTLVTALDRGIDGMAYGTVIRMCDRLHLNPVDFTSLDRANNELNQKMLENRVMKIGIKGFSNCLYFGNAHFLEGFAEALKRKLESLCKSLCIGASLGSFQIIEHGKY